MQTLMPIGQWAEVGLIGPLVIVGSSWCVGRR